MLRLGRAYIPAAEIMPRDADAVKLMRENRIIGAEAPGSVDTMPPGAAFEPGSSEGIPSVPIAILRRMKFTISRKLPIIRNCA